MTATLITGGAGYIGSHVAWACLESGRRVVIVDTLETGVRALAPAAAKLVIDNCGNTENMIALLNAEDVDEIVHCAASTVVPDSLTAPLAYYGNNVSNTIGLLAASVACGVRRFLFSSSAAVYAPTTDALISENHAVGPITPYGKSKFFVEAVLEDAANAHGFSWAALRYFNAAGCDLKGRTGQSTPKATHLIKVACEVALGKRPILHIYGDDYATPDGTCVRDYIHVSDLAQAHVQMLDFLGRGGSSGAYNCGYGVGVSVRQVIEAIERETGTTLPVRTALRRDGDLEHVVADATKLRESVGWLPQHASLQTIIRSALEWERRR